MPDYSNQSFEKISELLKHLSIQRGATAYALQDQIIPLDTAMDAIGPMTWALIMHADALARLTSLSTGGVNVLPITCVLNPETPYGNQAVVQSGSLPMSMAMQFLDAALEHAIALGINHFGYSASEWMALDPSYQVIPIEPYFHDLKTNWITETMESGNLAEIIDAWPRLQEVGLITAPSEDQSPNHNASGVINFPAMRQR